ncbi:MAG TPA: hypothetical protein VNI58_08330, partial [Mariprofundaceae bacterium]|nr:hypothetical protein [Mariprofundaceae bacterium]
MSALVLPTPRFVGMFDIIGFKALREKKGTAGLYTQFKRGIIPAIQHSAAGKSKELVIDGTPTLVPDFSNCVISYRVISDSVIFFTPDDSFDSFASIVHSAHMLIQFGFSGGKAPYRGAIGWGDLIDDQDILIGSAIEDAYNGENSQAWAGAMLTKNCRSFVERNEYIQLYAATHSQALELTKDQNKRRNIAENAKRLVLYRVPIQQNPKDG